MSLSEPDLEALRSTLSAITDAIDVSEQHARSDLDVSTGVLQVMADVTAVLTMLDDKVRLILVRDYLARQDHGA